MPIEARSDELLAAANESVDTFVVERHATNTRL
jgi:hypothetical protein